MATGFTRRSDRAASVTPSKGDRRERRLLVEAERLLAEGRFESASVTSIAAAAELTRPTFYFYFASKQALLTALVDGALADIAAQLADGYGTLGGSPVTRLRAAIAGAADAWWEHRAVMKAALRLSGEVPELYTRALTAIDPVNRMSVTLLTEHGTVPEARRPEDAQALVLTLAFMNERTFHHALRTAERREDLWATEEQLHRVWVRAMGLPDGPS